MNEVLIDYTNWRGERRSRRIEPTGEIRFEATDWHKEPSWLLMAVDTEGSGLVKGFAMKDIHSWGEIKK